MTKNDKIRDEKLWYDINRVASKIPSLSSGTMHKKWSFPLRVSSVNTTKSAGTYWKLKVKEKSKSKNNWRLRKKQADAIMNQNKRQVGLTNNDVKNLFHMEISKNKLQKNLIK